MPKQHVEHSEPLLQPLKMGPLIDAAVLHKAGNKPEQAYMTWELLKSDPCVFFGFYLILDMNSGRFMDQRQFILTHQDSAFQV